MTDPQFTRSHDKDMLIAGFKRDLAKARAEIERLRAALEHIIPRFKRCMLSHKNSEEIAEANLQRYRDALAGTNEQKA